MELNDRPATPKGPAVSQAELRYGDDLAPADVCDPVLEVYKRDIDRTLLIANLELSVAERLANFQKFMNSVEKMRGVALPPDKRKQLLASDDRV